MSPSAALSRRSAEAKKTVWKGGQKPSADLLEALRLLLEALGDGRDEAHEEGEGEVPAAAAAMAAAVPVPVPENGAPGESGEGVGEGGGSSDAGGVPDRGGGVEVEGVTGAVETGPAEVTVLKSNGEGCRDFGKEGGLTGGASEGKGHGQDEDKNENKDTSGGGGKGGEDDLASAAAALESSCLRSVCRQYMFGVDWRFVSSHRQFYHALLRLLQCALQPGSRTVATTGAPESAASTPGGVAGGQPLAASLLAPSADCPGIVDLIGSLCIALDDLVACPPQSPEPPPPPPPSLPQPGSPNDLSHLAPPSPASPLPTMAKQAASPLLQQQQQQQLPMSQSWSHFYASLQKGQGGAPASAAAAAAFVSAVNAGPSSTKVSVAAGAAPSPPTPPAASPAALSSLPSSLPSPIPIPVGTATMAAAASAAMAGHQQGLTPLAPVLEAPEMSDAEGRSPLSSEDSSVAVAAATEAKPPPAAAAAAEVSPSIPPPPPLSSVSSWSPPVPPVPPPPLPPLPPTLAGLIAKNVPSAPPSALGSGGTSLGNSADVNTLNTATAAALKVTAAAGAVGASAGVEGGEAGSGAAAVAGGGGAMGGNAGVKIDRLIELSRAIKEQLEHEQGIALAALARRVLDLAERVSSTVGEGQDGAEPRAIDTATAMEVEGAEAAGAVAAEPAATSASEAALGEDQNRSATTTSVLRNGSRGTAIGPRDGGGRSGAGRVAVPEAEAEAAAPSEEEAYVAAMKGLLFGTMHMKTSVAGAGGSREFFCFYIFCVFQCLIIF